MPSFFHVSERNHLGFILMSELARRPSPRSFVSLTEIARHMGLSIGYLEEIASTLKKAKLIIGKKGPHGGYCLAKSAKHITADQIIAALEGPVELVACQNKNAHCPLNNNCLSRSLWKELQNSITNTLKKITLAKLV